MPAVKTAGIVMFGMLFETFAWNIYVILFNGTKKDWKSPLKYDIIWCNALLKEGNL